MRIFTLLKPLILTLMLWGGYNLSVNATEIHAFSSSEIVDNYLSDDFSDLSVKKGIAGSVTVTNNSSCTQEVYCYEVDASGQTSTFYMGNIAPGQTNVYFPSGVSGQIYSVHIGSVMHTVNFNGGNHSLSLTNCNTQSGGGGGGASCSAPTTSGSVTNSGCVNGVPANNGTITINAIGGSGGTLYYRLNNGSWTTNNFFNNLSPGNYLAWSATDINEPSCWDDRLVVVSQDQCTNPCNGLNLDCEMNINNTGWFMPANCTESVCAGTDVQLAINPNGSTVDWTGPNGFVLNQTEVVVLNNIQPSQGGTYTAVYTDPSSGCQASQVITINVTTPLALQCEYNINNTGWYVDLNCSEPVCEGSDVQLAINPNGSTVDWTGPNGFVLNQTETAVINNIQPNQAGAYTATYTDAQGCQSSIDLFVEVIPAPVLQCEYNINNGGWYVDLNCTEPVCEGSDVQLAINPNGSTVDWTGPNGFVLNQTEIAVINNIQPNQAGAYTATYTDAQGCQSSIDLFVEVIPAPVLQCEYNINNGGWYVDLNCTEPVCEGSDVQLAINPNGSTVDWTGPNGFVLNQTEIAVINNIQPNQAGAYTATYTDAQGCQSSIDLFVEVTPSLALECEYNINNAGWYVDGNCSESVCEGSDVQLAINPNGSTVDWTGPNGFVLNQTETAVLNNIQPNQAGAYTATYTDAQGCQSSIDLFVEVRQAPSVQCEFKLDDGVWTSDSDCNINVCEGQKVQFSTPGCNNDEVIWVLGPNFDQTLIGGCHDFLIADAITSANNGTYQVTATNTATGCQNFGSFTINVGPAPTLNLGPDQELCSGAITLQPTVTGDLSCSGASSQCGTSPTTPNGSINGPDWTEPAGWDSAGVAYGIPPSELPVLGSSPDGGNMLSITSYNNGFASPVQDLDGMAATTLNGLCDGVEYEICWWAGVEPDYGSAVNTDLNYDVIINGNTDSYYADGTWSQHCKIFIADGSADDVSFFFEKNGDKEKLIIDGLVITEVVSAIQYNWSTGATSETITVITPGLYCLTFTDCGNCTVTDCIEISGCCNNTSVDLGPDQELCSGAITLQPTVTGDQSCSGASSQCGTSPTTPNGSINGPDWTQPAGWVQDGKSYSIPPSELPVLGSSPDGGNMLSISSYNNGFASPVQDRDGIAATTLNGLCDGVEYEICWWAGVEPDYASSVNTDLNYDVIINGNTDSYYADGTWSQHCKKFIADGSADDVSFFFEKNGDKEKLIIDGLVITEVIPATQYIWSTGATSETITVITPGQYCVTFTDCGNCTVTDCINIESICCSFTANAGPDAIICEGQSVILTASGGTSYLWSDGSNTQNITVSPLNSTTYTVTVSDANGCSDTDEVLVTIGDNPTANISSGNTEVCAGETTTLTASGGQFYSWSDGASSASITVGQGTYTVTVIDAAGCTDEETVEVIEKDEIVSGVQGPSQRCATENAQFQAVPPVAGATYTWTATGNPAITGGSATGSNVIYAWPNVPGIYTVTLQVSIDGCSKEFTQDINITDEVIAEAGPDVEICQGISTDLDGSGSSTFGDYNWTVVSGDFFSPILNSTTSSPTVSPNVTTEYELVVTDPVNNCTKVDRIVVSVNVNLNPTAVADANPTTVCIGDNVNLIGSNSLAPIDNPGATLQYFWFDQMPPAGFISNMADPTVSISENTTFTLIVADGACSDTTTLNVLVEGCSSIGDFIFEDLDGDGIQDLGEPGVGGVSVTLNGSKTASGAAVTQTMLTSDGTQDVDGDGVIDPLGYYNFTDLTPGSYFVSYTMPNGFMQSPVNQGGNDSNDSDFSGATNTTAKIVVGNNDQIDDVDGGIFKEASIQGTVAEDTNNDDNPDSPLAGVTLTLIDKSNGAIVATTTTNTVPTDLDGDGIDEPVGAYYFGNLLPGDYTIVETQPVGYTSVSDEDESNDGDPSDGNDPVNDAIPVTLTSGETDEDNDFVEELLGSISGDVAEDTDNDDIPDAPLGGVTLTLIDKSNGAIVATTTTNTVPTDLDGDGIDEPVGAYYFGNLLPGDYTIVETQPAGYTSVSDEDESNDGDPSDGNDPVNDAIPVTLAPGEDDEDNDFVEEQFVSIGSMVFIDSNNNGVLDGSESKLTDPTKLGQITIELYEDANGNGTIDAAEKSAPVATTPLNANGTYFFGNLEPGDYAVGFTPPASLSSSSTGNGGDDQVDNDDNGIQSADGADVISAIINLAPGTEPIDGNEAGSGSADDNTNDNNGDMTVDFGLYEPASISGLVSEDTDNDDNPDNPIGGVTLTLIDKSDGSTVATTTTNTVPTDLDGDGIVEPVGAYYFGDLSPGTYTVLETQPSGYDSVSDEDGSNDGDPTDGNDPVNDAIPVILTSGEDDEDNDFVEEALGTISGMVSEDTNNDDIGDVPLDNVTITLIDKMNGAIVATVQTADGVSDDLNNDGFIDPTGYYFFGDLPAGNYTVVETQPAGLDSVSDEDGSNDGDPNDGNDPVNDAIPVVLGAGENDDDNDFVEENLGSISGTVSEDTDNDDNPDNPLGGVTLTLIDKTTGATVASTVTNTVPMDLDGDGIVEPVGAYYFGAIPPGNYTIVETQPSGYDSVSDEDESNDGDPNDGNDPVNDAIPVTLAPGEDDEDNDFVEEQKVSIGSMVFIDSNNNGVLDGSESKLTDPTKLGQITIELYEDANGNGTIDAAELAAPVATTPLNADGTYYFGGLEPGDYAVGFTPPASLSSSSTGNGGDDETDNDDNGIQSADGASIISSVIELSPGTEPLDGAEAGSGAIADNGADDNGDMTIDFGLFEPAAISGLVGEDTNNDGAPEAPISGVTLTLIDKSNGAIVATTTTNTVPTDLDGDGVLEPVGEYYFGNLLPGDYTVVETQPVGYNSVSDQDGSNDGDPSDAGDPTNDAIPVTLVSGETDEDNDFVEERGSISGSVTEDTDDDDFGDIPLAGTSVSLVDKTTGAVVGSMNTITVPTDLNGDGVNEPVGSYYFGGLPAGNYTVIQNDSGLNNYSDVKDGDDSVDGDATDGIYNTDDAISVTLGAGEDDEDNNFVEEILQENLSIGSLVWNDEDNDGIKDPNEDGIAGVTVLVFEDANLDGLPDDINGDGVITTADAVGSDVTGAEIDTDGDGLPDDNNMDGVVEPLGTYYIDQLPAGDYVVVVGVAPMSSKQDGQPVTMISSTNTNTGDDQTDNDDNGIQIDTNGDGIPDGPTTSGTIRLTVGGEPTSEPGDKESTNPVDANGDNTVDFGFYIPAHLGNLVWVDDDMGGAGNNVYDPGETLVDGATITLYEDSNGNGVLDPAEQAAPIQTTTTDVFGEYEFSGLAPGVDYIVGFDQTTATNVSGNSLTWIPTFSPSTGVDDNSNVQPICGCSESVSLVSGETNNTIDGGLRAGGVVSLSLVDFYGRYNASRDVNEVTWITLNETNTDKFIVERSFENTNDFIAIGEVQGNENSTQEITYNFDDSDISLSGLYIYRLRQIDTDGRQSVKGPIGIRVQREVKTSVNVYPNPATNEVTFEITSGEVADMDVTMYNVAGKVVVPNFASTTLGSGNNKITVDLLSVPAGSYVLRIRIADKAYIKKLSVID